ncbi:MAG: DNA integrity scanning protein DisA nucleotide-binding domain protein [Deltaproteobacteria bacterium]|nr:DNA integrity scanning protein DisA nucleotide-binding domain protein [Deltaproteobacteria bacterium]
MQPDNVVILQAAFTMAVRRGAKSTLLFIDSLDDLVYPKPIPRGFSLILISKRKKFEFTEAEEASLAGRAKAMVTLPKLALTRLAKMKLALLMALSRGQITAEGPIVCIVGQSDQEPLDAIQFIDPTRENELLTFRGQGKISESIQPEVFQAVLMLSMELAEKGREGKPVGTTFVVGDAERVWQLSKQMIINPFKGYDEEERNILSPGLKETIREFSGLDGAFVIGSEGTVLTAGRYLNTAADIAQLPRGLGSRHLAAAGITALTQAVAFVISESSGDVRIFKDGKIIMEIEKSTSRGK